MTPVDTVHVQPGEMYVSRSRCLIHTLLGSCVSVVLYNSKYEFGGLNHFMLPRREICTDPLDDENILKYGEYAVPKLVDEMKEYDPQLEHIEAKIFGGCRASRAIKDMKICEENVVVARELLKQFGIPVTGECVLRENGIKLVYHNFSNKVLVAPIPFFPEWAEHSISRREE